MNINSYVIQLHSILKYGGNLTVLVDTVNGNAVEPFEIKLTVCNSFFLQGDCLMRNAYVDQTPVIIEDKQTDSYHTTCLFFEPHNSRMRQKAIDWLTLQVSAKTGWNLSELQGVVYSLPSDESARTFLESILLLSNCKVGNS